MIHAIDIHKSYGKTKALNGFSFEVNDGEVYGVIGPDGAGKSTLMRILTSLLIPDQGTVLMNNLDTVKDYKQLRQIIGYMPGKFSLYQDLTVEENLSFFATVFNTSIEENYHLIKDIYQQIEPFKTRKAGALSGGMKQKLALSCALIHKPEILILDEPTTGVDPVSRKEFWDMLARLKAQGITIVVSTAYMDEAGRCDRIALMREGNFIASNTPDGIVKDYKETLWGVKGDNMLQLINLLRNHSSIKSCFAFGEELHVTTNGYIDKNTIREYLNSHGCGDVKVYDVVPSVEDCFLALTQ